MVRCFGLIQTIGPFDGKTLLTKRIEGWHEGCWNTPHMAQWFNVTRCCKDNQRNRQHKRLTPQHLCTIILNQESIGQWSGTPSIHRITTIETPGKTCKSEGDFVGKYGRWGNLTHRLHEKVVRPLQNKCLCVNSHRELIRGMKLFRRKWWRCGKKKSYHGKRDFTYNHGWGILWWCGDYGHIGSRIAIIIY